jgi:hypothetical protein
VYVFCFRIVNQEFHILSYQRETKFEQGKVVNTMASRWIALFLMMVVWGCTGIGNNTVHEIVPRMTKDELKARLGSPGLIVLDVRTDRDWSKSELKIHGALRESPKAFEQWAGKYSRGNTFVLYCA